MTAPRHLTARSKRIFREIVGEYALEGEPHALEILRLALEALDRADEARLEIQRHGLTYADRFGAPRLHGGQR